MDRCSALRELKYSIERYEELKDTLNAMSLSWESGDPCEMASNDPGLQYEVEIKLDNAWSEIKDAADALLEVV